MRHRASPRFWQCYQSLPEAVRKLADRNFELLKQNPRHPSRHLRKIGRYWSVRVGLQHRALAFEDGSDLVWFWIGTHAEYDRLIGRK
ncbi:MAG TPA: hypothetical protein VNT79_03640 [Phycisphaerae bacterium]|nr:hypothetical protein [Phycisphaerae bacterium]